MSRDHCKPCGGHQRIRSTPIRGFVAGAQGLVENLGWHHPSRSWSNFGRKPLTYLIGSGKAAEICHRAKDLGADIIVLTSNFRQPTNATWRNSPDFPSQTVLEYYRHIADRAQTKEAQLQVELAGLEYRLPRLQTSYSKLSFARQRGGAYGTRGGGETKLELDRRVIKDRIAKLQDDLKIVEGQRATLRKQRRDQNTPVIALVGYTNAGKSSLLAALTGADVWSRMRSSLPSTRQPGACPCLPAWTRFGRYSRFHPQPAPSADQRLQSNPGRGPPADVLCRSWMPPTRKPWCISIPQCKSSVSLRPVTRQ